MTRNAAAPGDGKVAACLACIAIVVGVIAGCSSAGPTPRPAPRPVVSAAPPAAAVAQAPTTRPGEFFITSGMNDAWNAVGQILVRTDDVSYESRAQMLGIYALRYRGERFLIRTQAVPVRDQTTDQGPGLITKVGALWLDGKPNDSEAAVSLIRVLQRRMPAEIASYRKKK